MNILRLVLETLRLMAFTLIVMAGVASIVASGGGSSQPSLPTLLSESGSQTAQVGATATFSVTASNAEGYQWQSSTTGTWVDIAGARSASYTTPPVNLAMDGTQYRVVITGAGTTVTSATFVLTVTESLTAPTISVQPTDQSVVAGQSASLSVVAEGRLLSYLWQVSVNGGSSWSALGGATGADLTLPNLALADNGKRYRVIVSNSAGQVTSASALLSVSNTAIAAAIAVQPANQSVNIGGTLSLNVSAVGTGLSYQWQRSPDGTTWAAIAGATRSSLSVPGVAEADNGARFRVVVSNTLATVTSNAATLSVVPAGVVVAPSIVTQPTDQTVGEGQNATLSVTAGGTAPTYQWQVSSNSGSTWTDVGGAVGSTLVVAGVTLADSGKRYKVIVTNSAGSVESQSAVVTVTPALTPPTIATQPQGQTTRIVGQNVTLTVAANGTVSTYAWESSPNGNDPWTAVPSGNAATLVVSGLAISDNGKRYRVKVSNAANAASPVISNSAVVNVLWGEVTTSNDLSRLELTYDGSGGDSPGGGDGAGADGGGGLGKALNADLTVTRIADGALVGTARTDGATGLVRIKAGPGAAPLLLTLTGRAGATYFDEALGSAVPFGAGQMLHALVDQIDENLGVTPLTEAAYRYALNNFIANPAQVASGAVPLKLTATALELQALSKAQIQAANTAVLDELNRALPNGYKLTSLKSLPTPVDAGSGTNSLQDSRYGRMQVVTGGMVTSAGQFKSGLASPALAMLEQLALDLTDGKLDGYSLDGAPVSTAAALTYDAGRMPVAVTVGANQQAQRFSEPVLFQRTDIGVAEVSQSIGNPGGCTLRADEVALRKDSTVNIVRRKRTGCGQLLDTLETVAFTFPAPLSPVRQVVGNGLNAGEFSANGDQSRGASYYTLGDGRVFGLGYSSCGGLGIDAPTANESQGLPQPVPGLQGATSIGVGRSASLARLGNGTVVTWGIDHEGALGLNLPDSADPNIPFDPQEPTCTYATQADPFATIRARYTPQALSLSNITTVYSSGEASFAVAANGTLYGWGSAANLPFGTATETSPGSGIWNESLRRVPGTVAGITSVRSVASTAETMLALRRDGTVWAWGRNGDNGAGNSTNAPGVAAVLVPPPVVPQAAAVSGVSNVVQIAGDGRSVGYALRRDGTVYRWGRFVASANDATLYFQLPQVISGLPKIRNVARRNDGNVALQAETGAVYIYTPSTSGVPTPQ